MKFTPTPLLLLAPFFLATFAAPTKRDDISTASNYMGLPDNVLFMFKDLDCAAIASSHSLEAASGPDSMTFEHASGEAKIKISSK